MAPEDKVEVKTAAAPKEIGHRHQIRGIVTSDKMNKTRIISVKRRITHGLYQKAVIRDSKFFVHDEKNESKTGDLIIAEATRRLSKNKNFRLLKVLEKGA